LNLYSGKAVRSAGGRSSPAASRPARPRT